MVKTRKVVRNITTVVPWFGSNRSQAEDVGAALEGCDWVGIGFYGGGCEADYINARSVVANDLHANAIRLYKVIKHQGRKLYKKLLNAPISATLLAEAQARLCLDEYANPTHGALFSGGDESHRDDIDRAADYFLVTWQGRNGTAGQECELSGSVCTRWEAGGGDPAVRWKSAKRMIRHWQYVFNRFLFENMDVFDFIARCKKTDDSMMAKNADKRDVIGLYFDPPFPDAGEAYKHSFTDADHRRLAREVVQFKNARVCMRFYDHPLVRELYPEDKWEYKVREERDAHNKKKIGLLLTLKNGRQLAA